MSKSVFSVRTFILEASTLAGRISFAIQSNYTEINFLMVYRNKQLVKSDRMKKASEHYVFTSLMFPIIRDLLKKKRKGNNKIDLIGCCWTQKKVLQR